MISKSSPSTLLEFSFVSRLDRALPPAAVARLVGQAWRHNTRAGLTGTMRIRGTEVRQVLEGEVELILPLASRILSDGRHGDIRVLGFRPIEARRHAEWRVTGLVLPEGADHAADGASGVVPLVRPQARAADPAPATVPAAAPV